MDPSLPDIDLSRYPSWYWFSDKFDLPHEELFTTLHDRYNTKKFPLQDPVSFHRDVCECAEAADTREEFYTKLATRTTERIEQMTEAWKDTISWLSVYPQNMFCQLCYDEETREVKVKSNSLNDGPVERCNALNKFAKTMSFDSMVEFFDGFARDERKKQEDEMCRRMEKRKRFKSERAAECLATPSQAPGEAALDPTFHSSHRTASNKPKSSRDASTMNPPVPSATMSDKPNPTQPSRRRGPDQPEALAQTRTPKNLTRKRSDEGDANAKEFQVKKQRMMSTGEVDAERSVGPEQQRVAEVSSTLRRDKKRKRADDFQNDARKKQRRIIRDPIPSFTQSPEWSGTEPNGIAHEIITSKATSLLSIAVSHRGGADMTDEECDQRELGRLESNSSISTGNKLSFAIAQPSQNEDTGNRDGLTAKIFTISAGTRSPDRVPQPSRRQCKRQPCGEQRTPTPKKQTCQRKPREKNASPSVQQILQSNRSSRRGPTRKLLFLDDNGTACAVVAKKRN